MAQTLDPAEVTALLAERRREALARLAGTDAERAAGGAAVDEAGFFVSVQQLRDD